MGAIKHNILAMRQKTICQSARHYTLLATGGRVKFCPLIKPVGDSWDTREEVPRYARCLGDNEAVPGQLVECGVTRSSTLVLTATVC